MTSTVLEKYRSKYRALNLNKPSGDNKRLMCSMKSIRESLVDILFRPFGNVLAGEINRAETDSTFLYWQNSHSTEVGPVGPKQLSSGFLLRVIQSQQTRGQVCYHAYTRP